MAENENQQRLLDQGMKMYTLTDLEPILGLTHRTLLQWVYDGKLPAKKIGGRWRISEAALKQYLEAENS